METNAVVKLSDCYSKTFGIIIVSVKYKIIIIIIIM